jgi:hypothetical protein
VVQIAVRRRRAGVVIRHRVIYDDQRGSVEHNGAFHHNTRSLEAATPSSMSV